MKNVKIGNWTLNIGEVKKVDREIIRVLEKFLTKEWKEAVLEGIVRPWWSVKNLGIPSPVIRVDMIPVEREEDVQKSIYEVEARPAGLGVMLSLTPERIDQWKSALIFCQGFVSIESSVQDDKIAAEILKLPYYTEVPQGRGPYWIRNNYHNSKIALEDFSLVPIRDDRKYLIKLGIAEVAKIDKLDWSKPFVVKPLIGSRTEEIEIYVPGFLQKEFGLAGASTMSRVKRIKQMISNKKPYLAQRLSLKEEYANGKMGWTIWQVYCGWQNGKYRFLGGLWNWKPIHNCIGCRKWTDNNIVVGPITIGYSI